MNNGWTLTLLTFMGALPTWAVATRTGRNIVFGHTDSTITHHTHGSDT